MNSRTIAARAARIARSFLLALGLCCGWSGTAWATDVTLRLVDQSGTLIPVSQFSVLTAGFVIVAQNGVVTLPDGPHVIRLSPGLNGVMQGTTLFRDENVNVTGATQTLRCAPPTR